MCVKTMPDVENFGQQQSTSKSLSSGFITYHSPNLCPTTETGKSPGYTSGIYSTATSRDDQSDTTTTVNYEYQIAVSRGSCDRNSDDSNSSDNSDFVSYPDVDPSFSASCTDRQTYILNGSSELSTEQLLGIAATLGDTKRYDDDSASSLYSDCIEFSDSDDLVSLDGTEKDYDEILSGQGGYIGTIDSITIQDGPPVYSFCELVNEFSCKEPVNASTAIVAYQLKQWRSVENIKIGREHSIAERKAYLRQKEFECTLPPGFDVYPNILTNIKSDYTKSNAPTHPHSPVIDCEGGGIECDSVASTELYKSYCSVLYHHCLSMVNDCKTVINDPDCWPVYHQLDLAKKFWEALQLNLSSNTRSDFVTMYHYIVTKYIKKGVPLDFKHVMSLIITASTLSIVEKSGSLISTLQRCLFNSLKYCVSEQKNFVTWTKCFCKMTEIGLVYRLYKSTDQIIVMSNLNVVRRSIEKFCQSSFVCNDLNHRIFYLYGHCSRLNTRSTTSKT